MQPKKEKSTKGAEEEEPVLRGPQTWPKL